MLFHSFVSISYSIFITWSDPSVKMNLILSPLSRCLSNTWARCFRTRRRWRQGCILQYITRELKWDWTMGVLRLRLFYFSWIYNRAFADKKVGIVEIWSDGDLFWNKERKKKKNPENKKILKHRSSCTGDQDVSKWTQWMQLFKKCFLIRPDLHSTLVLISTGSLLIK